ncbi:hypothetical protein AAG570_010154 [Ranatra chinensis]|uniref:Ketosynthase family 3 (KS3) domain-containing protein n=1 Tax=Ranatra chinensis TaxID=642074 RepID=A0ABD0YLU1_9HEMI
MIECAYSGGLYALNLAYKLIASGRVNAALIGGCNILFKPQVSEQFKGMSKLTNSNKTKSFSADADGFNRSEGCIVLFLQRAEFAKRSYGTIKNVLCYNAGSRRNNFPEFCSDSYVELLKSAYSSCGIDPSLVSYVEADGTAIRRVDALELNSLAEVMCGTKRKTPLLVGSVKSNLGHFEGASSLISIAKAIIALKCSRIPPNLHFTAPNPDVPALFNGKMKVVTDSTPLTGDVVGVNVVDLSGCYGHVIIQQNSKAKSQSVDLDTNIPILLNISGRSETKLENVISKVLQ